MSVNPGFGGQAFIHDALDKLRQANALIGERPIDLEVDGGIGPETAAKAVAAGANVLVAGNAIYSGNDPATYAERIAALRIQDVNDWA
jgi:ribulose-phosphate 3-epimerase